MNSSPDYSSRLIERTWVAAISNTYVAPIKKNRFESEMIPLKKSLSLGDRESPLIKSITGPAKPENGISSINQITPVINPKIPAIVWVGLMTEINIPILTEANANKQSPKSAGYNRANFRITIIIKSGNVKPSKIEISIVR